MICGHCGGTHTLAEEVRLCGERDMKTETVPQMRDKQVASMMREAHVNMRRQARLRREHADAARNAKGLEAARRALREATEHKA